MKKASLFLTGFLQVFLVVVNTYFISRNFWPGVIVCSFMISFIWSFNVKKVAFGNMADRVIYSSGACAGGSFGLLISTIIT